MDPGRCESAAEVEGSEIYSPSPGAASVLRWQMSLHINQQTQHPQNQKPEMNWTAQKTLRTLCKRHKLKMNEQMHNQTIMSWRKNKKKSESIFGSIKNWKRRRQSVDHALSPSMHFRFPASRYAAVEWLVRKKNDAMFWLQISTVQRETPNWPCVYEEVAKTIGFGKTVATNREWPMENFYFSRQLCVMCIDRLFRLHNTFGRES